MYCVLRDPLVRVNVDDLCRVVEIAEGFVHALSEDDKKIVASLRTVVSPPPPPVWRCNLVPALTGHGA